MWVYAYMRINEYNYIAICVYTHVKRPLHLLKFWATCKIKVKEPWHMPAVNYGEGGGLPYTV